MLLSNAFSKRSRCQAQKFDRQDVSKQFACERGIQKGWLYIDRGMAGRESKERVSSVLLIHRQRSDIEECERRTTGCDFY